MRTTRTAAAAAAVLLLTSTACTPDPTINPPPPPPPSTVKLPEGWPDTVKPNQIDTYKKAITAVENANKIIEATNNDLKAVEFPDKLYKYADPDGELVKSERELLAGYRAAGWRTVGSAEMTAVPLARTVWNPNQVGIYVCGDGRKAITYDANGKKIGNGRIMHATLTVQNSSTIGWRVTGFEPGGVKGEFTETKQCGQGEN